MTTLGIIAIGLGLGVMVGGIVWTVLDIRKNRNDYF